MRHSLPNYHYVQVYMMHNAAEFLHRWVCIIVVGAEAESKAQPAAHLKADSATTESEK